MPFNGQSKSVKNRMKYLSFFSLFDLLVISGVKRLATDDSSLKTEKLQVSLLREIVFRKSVSEFKPLSNMRFTSLPTIHRSNQRDRICNRELFSLTAFSSLFKKPPQNPHQPPPSDRNCHSCDLNCCISQLRASLCARISETQFLPPPPPPRKKEKKGNPTI
jgi:hypothetical protein